MRTRNFLIGDLFDLSPGAFHATSELEAGSIPLVSCGEENNGVIGYYDIPSESTHRRALTVSFNGFPLTTNFHPYLFGAKDDVAVLVPKTPLSDGTLIYIAALLNSMKWRYSYGRKCYREKLRYVRLPLPSKSTVIDQGVPDRMLDEVYAGVRASAMRALDSLFPDAK